MNIKNYIGEVGKIIIVNCGEDISGSTTSNIRVKKPNGTITTWRGEVYTIGGRANYIRYVSVGPVVSNESVDNAIDSYLVVSHYPVISVDRINLYSGDTIVDTLTPSGIVGGVVSFTGNSTPTANLTLESGTLSIITGASGVVFNHAKIDYIFSGDFDLAGKYEIQAFIERGSFEGYGETNYIIISELFD